MEKHLIKALNRKDEAVEKLAKENAGLKQENAELKIKVQALDYMLKEIIPLAAPHLQAPLNINTNKMCVPKGTLNAYLEKQKTTKWMQGLEIVEHNF